MCDRNPEGGGGLAILDGGQLAVIRCLDKAILEHAILHSAREIGFASLTPVPDLQRIDYFHNFPHLGLAVSSLRRELLPGLATTLKQPHTTLSPDCLEHAQYMLPSAACYPVYSYLRDSILDTAVRVTTAQRCFRNETEFAGLARLLAFTMREIVAIGKADEVKRFLAWYRDWIARFAEGAEISLSVQAATDPFFETDGNRARMQQLFPVKEEFVFEQTVAVSSVNFHRNFFAERWNIRTADREYAFSGCIAFGLERWLHALGRKHEFDCDRMLLAISNGLAHANSSEVSALPQD